MSEAVTAPAGPLSDMEKRALLRLLLEARGGHPRTFPVSFGQKRLWFLDRLDPGNPIYNMSAAVHLEGTLDVAALAAALAEMVRRHEPLRTAFQTGDEEPLQVISPPSRAPLLVVDLSGLSAARLVAEQGRVADQLFAFRFDLERGGLLRLSLLRTGPVDHLVLVSLHHIICDEWSRGLFVRELATLYGALATRQASPLPGLPIQYSDFATWQRRWMQGPAFAAQLAFWKHALAGGAHTLELPTDRQRPTLPSGRGGAHATDLPPHLAGAVRRFSRARKATLFMTLLGAFQVLLARYCQQEVVTVGTPIAGRSRVETEPLIGFFVNTLALRIAVAHRAPFTEVLAQVREAALGAFSHQDLPFERLVEELQPERDLSHTPVFQVMFALENLPVQPFPLAAGLRILPFETARRTTKFDLTLFITDDDARLLATLEHSRDIFDAATPQRLLNHFRRLLAAAMADPSRPVGELCLLTAPELHQLACEWNDSAAELPRHLCLHDRLAIQAARIPDVTAVIAGEARLSFAALDRRANRLARVLRRHGAGPEVLVGVLLPRSIDMVVAALAVLKAGGAYVPLDADAPPLRLGIVMEDSCLRLVVTAPSLDERLPATGCLRLHAGGRALADEADADLGPTALPDNLAYVIYTSGSTGRPKGTLIPHRGVLNYLDWACRAYPAALGRGSVVHTPLSFDLTVTSLWVPLCAGRPVELAPEGSILDSFGDFLRHRRDLGLLKLTPAHLELLRQQVPAAEADGIARAFVVGGESLPGQSVDHWRHVAPASAVFNEYGPTETVVGCAAFRVASDRPCGAAVPIGRPIANVTLHVLDAALSLTPIGVAGELFIGGAAPGRGYLGRPDLTAARFVPDPWSGEPGARLYRSGDKVRRLPDGTLDFLGRCDEQLKIRGFRVEPAEIEAALCGHPAVEQAVVMALPGAAGQLRLVAFVVARAATAPAPHELRERAKQALPGYMVPAAFVLLPQLPLTVNGKLDRVALRQCGAAVPTPADDGAAAPRTPAETALAEIWREVLRLPRVGIHDSFFALGGDSILAVQVAARASRSGLQLTTAQIFQNQTIAELAAVAAEAETRAAAAAISWAGVDGAEIARRLATDQAEDVYPATPIQAAMLAYTQSAPSSRVGFEQVWCIVRGTLDAAAFRRAWRQVIGRHAVLRTAFVWEGTERPLQVVHRDVPLPLVEEDWRRRSSTSWRARLRQYLEEDRRRGFELGTAPMMRLALLRLEDEAHAVVWSNHHLLMDGWCRSLVLNEVLACYEAHLLGQEPRLAETRPYRDYVAWLEERDLATAEGFWRRTLQGIVRPARLGLAPRAAAAAASGEYARHEVPIPEEVSDRLQALVRRHHLTASTAVKGAWAVLLGRYSGEDDLVLGAIFSGRPAELPGADSMVGLFMNILPMRVRLAWTQAALPWLAHLQLEHSEYHRFEHTPLARIQDWSAVPPGLRLFDTLFVFENFPVDAAVWKRAGSLVVEEVSAAVKTNYALTLMVAPTRQLTATLVHDAGRLDRTAVLRMARHLGNLLAALAADPQVPLDALPMLAAEESRQLMAAEAPARLLDHRLQAVPAAVPGQLFLRIFAGWGAGPAIPDPFGPPGALLLATDQAACHGADGTLLLLGELSRRAALPGFGTVDLWEIEAALSEHPAVQRAAVIGAPSEGPARLLAGFVPAAGATAPLASELQSFLRSRLPAPMVPAAFAAMAEIPRTAHGRLDAAALADLVAASRGAEQVSIAPRNLLESKLLRIWEEVLQRHPVSVTDSFFELGGNSLLALRLMARIRQELGRELPLSIFFQSATIEDLALSLRDDIDYFATPLVAIQPRGTDLPLLCVHPIGGSIMSYVALVPHLGENRPLYGLEARHRPYESLEALAADYAAAVEAHGPAGPWMIGGWSFGGLVAFEMARQRELLGQEVALLALFDTGGPVEGIWENQPRPDFGDLRELVRQLDPTGRRLPMDFRELQKMEPGAARERVLEEAKRRHLVPRELQLAEALRDLAAYERRGELARGYLPQGQVRAPVVLFRCDVQVLAGDPEIAAQRASQPALGWQRYCAQPVEVVAVPGSHESVLSAPAVDVLGRRLREVVDAVAARCAAGHASPSGVARLDRI